MRALLFAAVSLAAVIVVATPAQAQSSAASAFVGVPSHGVTIHWGHGGQGFRSDFADDRRDRRRGNGDGDVFIGEWPQQGDTAWRADSYNDWWHERPDRAYPRWLSTNSKCERLWWSGSGWRC